MPLTRRRAQARVVPILDSPSDPRLGVLVLVLVALALFTMSPLWLPLALAAWVADLLTPGALRLERLLHGRRRSAAAILVLVVLAVVFPLTITSITVIGTVRDVVQRMSAATDWADVARRYGADAWSAAQAVASVSMAMVLGAVVFAIALYNFLAHRTAIVDFIHHHAPLPRDVLVRFEAAFLETGRGLIVGIGATAFLEGMLATIVFFALGIPRAFVLGALTAAAGLTPVLGTAPVWVPLAASLFLAGDHVRGVAIVVLGIIFGLVDNFVRPVLTRYGKLDLPSFVLLVAMLGGIAVFGPSGAILGPLVVRLAVEAMRIARERRSFA